MSLSTSILFYRPTVPPIVNAGKLLKLINRLFSTSIFGIKERFFGNMLEIKYGTKINQDDVPSLRTVYDDDNPCIGNLVSVKWDIINKFNSNDEIISELNRMPQEKPIYRASIDLGPIPDYISKELSREPCKENSEGLYFDSFHFECDVITADNPDFQYQIGWLVFSINGSGYPFPWSLQYLFDKIQTLKPLREIESILRSSFPVSSTLPTWTERRLRNKLGETWLYPIDVPMDWFWYISVS